MIHVRFTSADGLRVVEIEAAPGARLLDVAQAAGQPLEGTCGGAMACATCHVVLDAASYAALGRPSAEEEDMLDFAAGSRRGSRLSCQVRLVAGMDVVEVRVVN